MPAKKQITKEKIFDAALEVVRQSGISALNMRSLADACKCSTQPIYHSFAGMDDLKTAVAKAILNVFNGYIENEIAKKEFPEYKAVGMGYIRFAKEEKQFFKYLLMNDGMAQTGMQRESFDTSVFMIMKNYGLYQDAAAKLHMQMWIFVHGIASMFATDYIDLDWETVSGLVSDAYFGFVNNLKDNKNDN